MRKHAKRTWYIVHIFQPFPMPYLISLKVPAFSQYSTCWDFYSIFVLVFKYLYTVLQGFWWRNPRARAFLLSWNQLILEGKKQRGTHCSQSRFSKGDQKETQFLAVWEPWPGKKGNKSTKYSLGEGEGVWGAISPLWPIYHPIWFKTSTLT